MTIADDTTETEAATPADDGFVGDASRVRSRDNAVLRMSEAEVAALSPQA